MTCAYLRAVALEGVFLRLRHCRVEIFHGDPAFDRTHGVPGAVWETPQAACLELEG